MNPFTHTLQAYFLLQKLKLALTREIEHFTSILLHKNTYKAKNFDEAKKRVRADDEFVVNKNSHKVFCVFRNQKEGKKLTFFARETLAIDVFDE
jgi:hypothetical protein